VALDFGLFDNTEVAIYFRDYQRGVRKLRAVFPGPDRQQFIQRQRDRYKDLATQCWLVSSSFACRLETLYKDDLSSFKTAVIKNALVTARELGMVKRIGELKQLDIAAASLADCYLFGRAETNIPDAVEQMLALRRAARDFQGPPAGRAQNTAG
jgi:hypothetical protein